MRRLVCIGDSLTQGFKSGAIFETNLSYPAIIAWEMGIPEAEFRYPSFGAAGGLPINIEYLLRKVEHDFGPDVNLIELPLAAISLRQWMDEGENYWERGPGAQPIGFSGIYDNLAVWGFEIQDAYQVTADLCRQQLARATDNWLSQVPEQAMFRTALRVLNPSQSPDNKDATQVSLATRLARTEGIENLIVFLGANNVLSSVTSLQAIDSTARDLRIKNPAERKATVYTPQHFGKLLDTLMKHVEQMGAGGGHVERVFWGTVPPVTIPPVTHGVGGRMGSDEGLSSPYGADDDPRWYRRYFRYYTRPWVSDQRFNAAEDSFLTGKQAMQIDWTIAQYNRQLKDKIARHNEQRKRQGGEPDWFLVDIHQALERLAYRRYSEDPSVPPPPAWTPYELPQRYLDLALDTRFLGARNGVRVAGGIFSLDGIHATTAGYGLLAQEFINVMQAAGVAFFWGDASTPRVAPVAVDCERLIRLDTLLQALPQTLDDLWAKLVDGDQLLDLFKRGFRWAG